jgi:predicted NBD/HSP70 family sugar kinase
MKSFLPNDIKDQNRKIIFDILLQNPEQAKVEVTQKTTMSFVTVSKIIDYFEEIGIVSSSGESRDGSGGLGRKRAIYTFNENSYVTIGIQIIENTVHAVLVNLHSEIIASYNTETAVPFYNEDFKVVFGEVVQYLKGEAKKKNATIIGVGIGVDGAINKRNSTIRMRTNNTQEQDYSYTDILKNLELQIDLPIVLENDVNAAVLAELSYLDKLGEGPEELLQIALGEGIGAGIILDKKLYRGYNAGVGELEYMCFDSEYINKPSSVGWLESKLGFNYLKEAYGFSDNEVIKVDKKKEIIAYISKHLALVIINIVSLLDISNIILSGRTVRVFPNEILKATGEKIKQFTGWDLEIATSEKTDSTAVGAAILSLESEMTKIISS